MAHTFWKIIWYYIARAFKVLYPLTLLGKGVIRNEVKCKMLITALFTGAKI